MNRIAFYLPRRRPILLVILGILSLVTSGLRADQSAATQPGFEVKEWLILVSAPNQPHANSSSVFTFLPDVMDPLRAAPPGEPSKPCPVGVIRVSGQIDTKFAIR